MIAALYIDPRGPYPKMADVDCWDEARDARKHAGPWPVVAHPPCGPWGSLFRKDKAGGRDLALRAVEQVRAFGGVLEHPAHSKLWRAVPLPFPCELSDAWGGCTYAVEQVAWGHSCRKPTWLYVVGVPACVVISGVRRGGEPTHQIWGSRMSGHRHRVDLKAAHSAMRRLTPPAFAEWLVSLARSVKAKAA